MGKRIPLNKNIQVKNSAHILYIYDELDCYLENMMAYIREGLDRNHHLLIIENSTIYQSVEKRINDLFSMEEKKCIHYIDNYSFYGCYGDFHIHSIVEHFGELLNPFFNKKLNVRTWAHVEWKDQDDISKKIEKFENTADCSVNEMGLMSVCAYNSSKVTAFLQTAMMRSHEYIMTDREFVKSSLYRKML
jgi:hypothetical protein